MREAEWFGIGSGALTKVGLIVVSDDLLGDYGKLYAKLRPLRR